MAHRPDAIDVLIYNWAATRRQLLGAMRCSLGNVKTYRDGAGARTARQQSFPEVYTGDALLVNLAVKRMPPDLRDFVDIHYTLGRGATKRAELLGITTSIYWRRVNAAKSFVAGYLAARQER
jgi:hypothetical protein